MKFIIKRSEWLHGEGSDKSYLLREEDNKMCCLGFLAIHCGAKSEDILEMRNPMDVKFIKWPSGIIKKCKCNDNQCDRFDLSDICYHLLYLNDKMNPSEIEREKLLTEEFSKIDINVEFVD